MLHQALIAQLWGGNLMVKYWSSKSISGVRFPPTSVNFTLFRVSRSILPKLTFFLLACFLYTSSDLLLGGSFSQKLVFTSCLGLAIYWVVSIFVFLFKRSLFTSYTTVIQRYWKRALYLFWALELFLFGIYLYLVLVAPTEVEWLLDQPQLFKSAWWWGVLFFNKLLTILAVVLLSIVLSFTLVNGNRLFFTATLLFITLLLSSVLFTESAQSLLYSIYFSGVSWSFDLDSGLWALGSSVDKTRVITQYVFVVILLKFWHTLFIVSFWLVSVMFSLQAPYTGQGAWAANKQNFFFLYGFAFIWVCFLFKTFNNYLYEYTYEWFIVSLSSPSLSISSAIFEPLLCLVG